MWADVSDSVTYMISGSIAAQLKHTYISHGEVYPSSVLRDCLTRPHAAAAPAQGLLAVPSSAAAISPLARTATRSHLTLAVVIMPRVGAGNPQIFAQPLGERIDLRCNHAVLFCALRSGARVRSEGAFAAQARGRSIACEKQTVKTDSGQNSRGIRRKTDRCSKQTCIGVGALRRTRHDN
jgi:hypothetical protein